MRPEIKDIVAGESIEPRAIEPWLHDPATGAAIEPMRASTPETIERALSVAYEAAPLPVADRIRALERIASRLEGAAQRIASCDARGTGVVFKTAERLGRIPAAAFRAAAAQLRDGILESRLGDVEVQREPRGVAVVVAPWNAPAPIAAHKVASAIAAGCRVILKPSEHAPHSAQILAEAIDLPRGLFQLVHGGPEVGARLVSDERVAAVSLTGGAEAGRAVATACASRLVPVQLELGGNNPLVVLGGDLERAAEGIVAGLVTLNGQWCRAVGKVILHRSIAEECLARTIARLGRVHLGDPMDATSEMGPLIHRAHRDGVKAAVESLGGEILAPGVTPERGWFLAPALVTGCSIERARREIFGPVATVHVAEDDDEALALANDGPFGLAAYAFGDDVMPFARKLGAGTVKVNGVTLFALHPEAPRPAWGMSGLGDEGTRETLLFFTRTRVLGRA